MAQNIILVGYRCTGKTTVGRLLAERLARPFADADDLVEARAGRSIKDIFASESEAGFRDRESAALKELCSQSAGIISTGGGAVLRESNRALLKTSGFVVWLTAAPETVWDRLQTDPTTAARRPNLTATGGEAEVRALIAARDPLYRDVAHFTVASDALSPEGVVEAVLKAWTKVEGSSTG